MFERRLLAWTDQLHDWLLDRIWRRETKPPTVVMPVGIEPGDLLVVTIGTNGGQETRYRVVAEGFAPGKPWTVAHDDAT